MGRRGAKKSRNGCVRCKERHVKCDEQKPCGHCVRHDQRCSLAIVEQEPTLQAGGELPVEALFLSAPCSNRDGIPYDTDSPSAFAATVQQSSIALSIPYSESWAQDAFLMHHYTKHTSLTLSRVPEIQELWQSYVPQLASSNIPLMHGVLSVAALHLNYLDPEQRVKYMPLASRHYGMALSAFRAALPAISKDNCNALFALAILVAVFAKGDSSHHFRAFTVSDLVETLILTCGVRNVLDLAIGWILSGPSGGMVGHKDFNPWPKPHEPSLLPISIRIQFNMLREKVQETSIGAPESFRAIPSPTGENRSVIDLLESVYASSIWRISDDDDLEMGVVYRWAGLLSTEYLDLLRDHDPTALVVLAHYVILTSFCEKKWYHSGWTASAITAIRKALPPEWIPLLRWPEEQLANGFWTLKSANNMNKVDKADEANPAPQ